MNVCACAAPGEEEDGGLIGAGYADAEEGVRGIAGTPPEKMTVQGLKAWLTEQGHEDAVWRLTQARAKKPDYVAAARAVLGGA